MPHAACTRSAIERGAFRSVLRACYAGLDSVTLRLEVARRAAPVLSAEAYSLATTDPETGLLTHSVRSGVPPSFARDFFQYVYPQEEAEFLLDMARRGCIASTSQSDSFRQLVRNEGFAHEARAVLCADGAIWGLWCALREAESRQFGARELRFLRAVAPHMGRALKAAAQLQAAVTADATGATSSAADAAVPGVVVLDTRGQLVLRTAAAARQLRDLADVDPHPADLPLALLSAVGLARTGDAWRAAATEDTIHAGELRARGRSGCWYSIRASLAEPGADGLSKTVVVITPVTRGDASILARLYGLSPREREVLALVLRGETTRRIAARLGISAYTAQDHLDRACDKVGVRGRRALLAKLFFDGYAQRMLM